VGRVASRRVAQGLIPASISYRFVALVHHEGMKPTKYHEEERSQKCRFATESQRHRENAGLSRPAPQAVRVERLGGSVTPWHNMRDLRDFVFLSVRPPEKRGSPYEHATVRSPEGLRHIPTRHTVLALSPLRLREAYEAAGIHCAVEGGLWTRS
jgi:hypothetical protein